MELLAEVQLTDKATNQVKELSGGQKQRFSIAVGLVNDPKVLFLDEPTTGLDPQARRNLWELVGQIKRKGTTVVLTLPLARQPAGASGQTRTQVPG